MSIDALQRAHLVTPLLREQVAALPVPENQGRPDWRAVALVHLHLCDKHRRNADEPRHAAAAESVEQIRDATGLPAATVRRALKVLDELGHWVAGERGGPGRPTRRYPSFIDCVPPSGAQCGDELRSDPEQLRSARRNGELRSDPDELRSDPGQLRSARRSDTPVVPPVTPVSSSSDEDDELVETHMERHIEWNRHSITSPAAIRATQLPKMRTVVKTARAEGSDPEDALEQRWETRAHLDSFDPADWSDDRPLYLRTGSD